MSDLSPSPAASDPISPPASSAAPAAAGSLPVTQPHAACPRPCCVCRGERGGGTIRSPLAWITLLGVMALAIFTDLGSKHAVFMGLPSLGLEGVAGYPVPIEREAVLIKALDDPRLVTTLIPRHQPVEIVPSLLEFTLVLNPGAIFGMGPGQRWFFVGFSLLALAFGVWMFLRWTGPRDRWSHVGIALLLGGGLGNLYDRLVYACVRDFIHPLPGLKWPFGWKLTSPNGEVWPYVSNLADLYLLVGILILLAVLWRRDRAMQKHAKPTTAPSAPAAQLQN